MKQVIKAIRTACWPVVVEIIKRYVVPQEEGK